MKAKIRYFITALCLLVVAPICSCTEEVPEYEQNLCSGYWASDNDDSRLLKFEDGNLFVYVSAKDFDDSYYEAYYDVGLKYTIDPVNSTLCMLPDNWYDIYVLTRQTLVLASGESIDTYIKVPNGDVRVVSKENFLEKYGK